MRLMITGLLTAAAIAAMPLTASALTFKKGQVLGSDGQIYDGASPDVRARLIAKAQDGGKSAGISGNQLFVVVNDTITFVPIADIAGKSEETVKEIVVEAVTETVTEALTAKALANAGADINLAEEAEVDAALESIAAADIAGVAATEAAAATKEAWENISQEDLEEATAYAAEFAAQEAAKVIEHQNLDSQLQDLIDSGATEAEIDAFIEANPAPE